MISRRLLLGGLIAAPAIVRAPSLMRISARAAPLGIIGEECQGYIFVASERGFLTPIGFANQVRLEIGEYVTRVRPRLLSSEKSPIVVNGFWGTPR